MFHSSFYAYQFTYRRHKEKKIGLIIWTSATQFTCAFSKYLCFPIYHVIVMNIQRPDRIGFVDLRCSSNRIRFEKRNRCFHSYAHRCQSALESVRTAPADHTYTHAHTRERYTCTGVMPTMYARLECRMRTELCETRTNSDSVDCSARRRLDECRRTDLATITIHGKKLNIGTHCC